MESAGCRLQGAGCRALGHGFANNITGDSWLRSVDRSCESVAELKLNIPQMLA